MYSVYHNYPFILLESQTRTPAANTQYRTGPTSFYKHWPDDGLFRPQLVTKIWNNKIKRVVTDGAHILFILILYFKPNGTSSTKITLSSVFNGKLPDWMFMYPGNGLLISQNVNTSVTHTIVAWLDNETTFETHGKFVLKIGRFPTTADKTVITAAIFTCTENNNVDKK
jgi:hypothetical protein